MNDTPRGAGLRAVFWKEWRELLLPARRPSGNLIGGLAAALLAPLLAAFLVSTGLSSPAGEEPGFAVFFPPAGLVFTATISVFVVVSLGPESFAGERERHTLEALLATRLHARDILWGKMFALGGYGLTLSVIGMIVYVLAILVIGAGTIAFVATLIAMAVAFVAAVVGIAFLLSLGILISMRAKTVKSAQQTMAFALMPLFVAPAILSALGPLLVDDQTSREQALAAFFQFSALVGGGFVLLTVLLLVLAVRAFERERLLTR